ncbi:MAG: DNA polymerase IV, partial [Atopobium sp.]|nr:DNA polymerase IV [Atopobium sp.]
QQGIKTLGELSRADATYLTSLVGNTASKMILRAQGKEVSEVHEAAQPRDVKSVSNERTFEADLFDKQEIEEAIRHIAGVVGRRLRRKQLQGYTVTLKVKASATESHTAQKRMSTPTDDEHLFAEIAVGLLSSIWKEGQPVRLLGVGISSFSDEEHAKPVQESLFDQYEATFDAAASGPTTKKKPRSDLRHLSEVTDKLKDKFGTDAVQYGRDLRFEHRVSDTMPTGKNEQI